MELGDCTAGRDGDPRTRSLQEDGARVEGLWREGLDGYPRVRVPVEEGVVKGCGATEAAGA